jgi:Micrococcal nuclease (thermonuclease) homologs
MEIKDIYTRNAKVTNIVDGDTFDAEVDLGFHIKISDRFRVLGIDAPEKFGVTKAAGLKSKQYLVDNILNKDIVIISNKMDGFRRYLADVYITNADGSQSKLADIMLNSRLAIAFCSET